MIDVAQSLLSDLKTQPDESKRPLNEIEFVQGQAESLGFLKDKSVDMITAGERASIGTLAIAILTNVCNQPRRAIGSTGTKCGPKQQGYSGLAGPQRSGYAHLSPFAPYHFPFSPVI